MNIREYLNKIVTVVVDRPLGSKHPKWDFVYPINYGFIEGVKSPDGEDLDAYILGVNTPLDKFTGKVIAVVHRIDDDDDKLIVAPSEFSDEEIEKKIEFQEKWFKHEIIR